MKKKLIAGTLNVSLRKRLCGTVHNRDTDGPLDVGRKLLGKI